MHHILYNPFVSQLLYTTLCFFTHVVFFAVARVQCRLMPNFRQPQSNCHSKLCYDGIAVGLRLPKDGVNNHQKRTGARTNK